MHYIIIIVVIFVIVIIQFKSFGSTKQKINNFLWIFPKKPDEYKLQKEALITKINSAKDDDLDKMLEASNLNVVKYYYPRKNTEGEDIPVLRREKAREDLIAKLANDTAGISVSHNNDTLKTIVDSINDYLKNNKTISDFHLMKDIVDRNFDTKEEEIDTQIPVPLYMGLVGTMMGILVGIGYLVISGDLSALLGETQGSGASGVNGLLGGVALAMISSILGIILTTLGSHKFKTAKSIVESNKHTFLSWIQAKLLPTLSDNVVGAIREMAENLNNFNAEFAQNTGNLGSALAKVNESYKLQMQLIDTVNKIQEGRTAATNLTLLSKLIESSEQIGQLANYLNNTNEYLANVKALNEKLDNYDQRSQIIENAGEFYKRHDTLLSGNINDIKQKTEESLKEFSKGLSENLLSIKDNLNGQLLDFANINENQQKSLRENAEELNKIVKALSELGEVQKAVKEFKTETNKQTQEIIDLAKNLKEWATAKETGGKIQVEQKLPQWLKNTVISGIALMGVTCLAVLIPKIIEWINLLF